MMREKISYRDKVIGVLVFIALWASVARLNAETKPGSSFPIKETVQGWSVTCQGAAARRVCVMSEGLKWKESNHLAVLFEVRASGTNVVFGQLTVPFGVDLPAGATLQVDSQTPWAPMGYRTCLPQGCLIPIEMKETILQAFRSGKTLKVALPLINGRGETSFSLPLDGFDTAYIRMKSLAATKPR